MELEVLSAFGAKGSHVLWSGGLGSMADRGPDRVAPVLVLPHPRAAALRSGGLPRCPDEPHLLLRLLHAHRLHRHWVVHHRVLPRRFRRRVSVSAFFLGGFR